MNYRSWLFVPANDEQQLSAAVGTGADVILVDLKLSVPMEFKQEWRRTAADWLNAHRRNLLEQRRLGRWVRINPMDGTGMWREDLLTVMAAAPDGIMLPNASGPEAVRQLAAELYELEQHHHIAANSTRIVPLVGESPRTAMTIGHYLEAGHQRLAGLAWGVENLAASIFAARQRHPNGGWADPFAFVRSQIVLTAHACGLMAIDAAHADIEDEKGLVAAAREARADGFTGMLAVHSDQIAAINEAFTPSEEELQQAREIVAAFEANPHAGALHLQGRAVERSHLNVAQRVLGLERKEQSDQPMPILRPA